MRSTSHEGIQPSLGSGIWLKRDLHLVERVVARFVDARRLACRADEQARKQVRHRRVVLPIGDDAAEQVRAAKEGAVGGRGRAEHDVVAAAGAGVAAVDHELLGAEPRQARLLVEHFGDRDGFIPVRRRVDVHLDDAGVGRDLDDVEPPVGRRMIAFDVNGLRR